MYFITYVLFTHFRWETYYDISVHNFEYPKVVSIHGKKYVIVQMIQILTSRGDEVIKNGRHLEKVKESER